jgi:predicted NBD/HSP70 family sugar kinase
MARAPAARPEAIRRHNLGLLLEQVHRDGELTRAELTQRLGLNRSTIGALVNELISLGLINEHVPSGNERAGRPSHVVSPRLDGPFAFAVDIEVDRLVSAAVGLGGHVIARREERIQPGRDSADQVAIQIAEQLEPLREQVAPCSWPVGVGVSIPGTVRRADGWIDFAPNLGWRHRPLARMLTELVPSELSVHLGNDADLGALAEHVRGAARDCHDVVYITGKVGVGSGIIADSVPLRGHAGLAGELGHMMLDSSGPPCHCGSQGCVETYIGEAALLRLAHRDVSPSRESVAEVIAAARAGERNALDGVRAVAVSLGRAAANLVNLLNPEAVIMGGSLADVLELCRADVEEELHRRAMSEARWLVELRTASLGDDSSLLGAAELAFGPLLSDPVGSGLARSA